MQYLRMMILSEKDPAKKYYNEPISEAFDKELKRIIEIGEAFERQCKDLGTTVEEQEDRIRRLIK